MSASVLRLRQRFLAAGIAGNVVFLVSLILPWFDLGSYDSMSGWTVLPAAWAIALVCIAAIIGFVAEMNAIVLPLHLAPMRVAAYCSSIPLWFSGAFLVAGGGTGRSWGLVIAVLGSVIATVAATRVAPSRRR